MPHDASVINDKAKYKQVRDLLYQRLLSTNVRPGQLLWTEAELIESLGVSVTTVRRALDELVRQDIIERKVGKGTFLKSLPGSDRPTQDRCPTESTVLMLSCMTWAAMHRDAYFGEIVRHTDRILGESGHHLSVLANVNRDRLGQIIEDIDRRQPAGLVIPYAAEFDDAFFARLATLGLPLMLIGYKRPGFGGTQVYFDESAGGRLAADHLLSAGHTRFAVIGAPTGSAAGVHRCQAFRDRILEKGGQIVHHAPSQAGYHELDGYEVMDKFVAQWQSPSAVFCASDLLAFGAIKRVEKFGVRVPGDLAVMGYGSFRCESLYHPNLTTVCLDLAQMASEIGAWLQSVARLERGSRGPSAERVLPVRLILGDTA